MVVTMMAARSARSEITWKRNSAPMSARGTYPTSSSAISSYFCQRYETGAMRRCTLRGTKNILKRQLIHVGAFNISLVLRKMLGVGTLRELNNSALNLILRLFAYGIALCEAAKQLPAHSDGDLLLNHGFRLGVFHCSPC
jgi:hypothetical protein